MNKDPDTMVKVPLSYREKLRAYAKRHHRYMNQQLMVMIDEALEREQQSSSVPVQTDIEEALKSK